MPEPTPYPLAVARRLVLDLGVCPACLQPLFGARCDVCGLELSGDAGARVWAASLEVAEALDRRASTVAGLRAAAGRVDAPLGDFGSAAWPSAAPGAAVPVRPVAAVVPTPPHTWPASTVLQALGAALLAVAAVVLVAFSWGALDTAARLTSATVPAVAALVLAPWLRRRALPHGAESVGTLAVALVLLDTWAIRRAGVAPGLSGAMYAALTLGTAAVVLAGWGRATGVRAGAVCAPALAVAAAALATGPSADWAVVAACAVAAGVLAAQAVLPWRDDTATAVAAAAATAVGAPTALWLGLAALGTPGLPGSVTFGSSLPAGPDGLRLPGLLVGALTLVATAVLAAATGPATLRAAARHLAAVVGTVALLAATPATCVAVGMAQPAAALVPFVALAAGAAALDRYVAAWLRVETRALVAVGLLLALDAAGDARGWSALVLTVAASCAVAASTWVPGRARVVLRVSATALGWGALILACAAVDVSPGEAVGRVVVVACAGLAVAVTGARVAAPSPTAGDERVAHGVTLLVLATADAIGTLRHAPLDAVLALLGAALLLVGALRLRAVPDAGSWRTVGAGAALLLGPTALGLLAEPEIWRLVVLVCGGVVAVVAGARLRLQAPFVLGASALAVVALRELAPVARAAGWWPVVAVGGAILLAAGLTYERRLRDARYAAAYVSAMR